jgi:predicted ATPase/class 3 adenylate cyclase
MTPVHRDLPVGTVTFLFTDVEGSTKLLHALGAAGYAEALAEHRRILRDAFTAHGGVEVDTQGDAFFVAFPTADGAGRAAAAALAGLAAGPIRVRMGIHTGTPHLAEEGYVGTDVHRAARIAASGHGDQVLVSSSTAALVGDDGLRDLGLHRLKDLSAPERIYQLGSANFPPLRTLHQTNLPIPSTSFLGREPEVAEVRDLLSRDGVHLLTLIGPGGIGKTRLALQAAGALADSYADGVWWVPLAALRDPRLVLETAAHALGAKSGLIEHIADRSMLLLLDNFEHVAPAAADLAAVLASCPNLDLLVTSREPLRLTGEQRYPVSPLVKDEGVALFVARARAVKPGFQAGDAVARICVRLDGLPLAIELAAARVAILPAEAILKRLGRTLDLLSTGSRDLSDRQRTLRGAIDWSYELLDGPTRTLFARLAAFAGGASLEEIDAVCGDGADVLDRLGALVDHSLVGQREIDGEPRFAMLATIREYALERLDVATDADPIRRRHAAAYLALATRVHLKLKGPAQRALLDRLERDHDNLRAATEWAITHEPAIAMRLVGSMWRFWHMHGHLSEAQSVVERVLALPHTDDRDRLRALGGAGGVAYWQGDMLLARRRYEEALAIATRLGDRAQVAEQIYNASFTHQVGTSDIPHAIALGEQALAIFRELGDRAGIAKVLWANAYALYQLDERARVRPMIEECIPLLRELEDRFELAWALEVQGLINMKDRRFAESRASIVESLQLFHEVGDLSGVTLLLMDSAMLAALRGDLERAVRLFAAGEKLRDESGAMLANVVEAWQVPAVDAIRAASTQLAGARDDGRRLSREEAVALAVT